VRHGIADDREDAQTIIVDAATAQRGDHPEDNPHQAEDEAEP
jgi:hypothetical protein